MDFLEEKMRAVYAELEDLKKLVPKKAKLRAVRLKTAKKENAYHYFIRKDGYGQNGEYIRKKDRELDQSHSAARLKLRVCASSIQ